VRAALIPPKGLYTTALASDMHLALAHLMGDKDYRHLYENLISDHDYLILDNGAAEGSTVSDKYLLTIAFQLGADEIVLPDVIRDAEETIKRGKQFLQHMAESQIKPPNLMGVLQSTGPAKEWQTCLEEFAKIDMVTTIGVPRHFVNYDKYMRHQVLTWINYWYKDRFQVHLLGMNSRFPSEVANISREHPWVRSCDSSLPYNYTIAGWGLSAVNRRVERPANYFDTVADVDTVLLYKNIDTYLGWAHAIKGTRS
jgi:hypothetical protein